MKRLASSSALNPPAAAGGQRGLAFLSGGGLGDKGFRSTWTLAAAGLIFAATAANMLCLSPRWYSSRFISLVYEPAKFVVLTAATGAAAVQIFWSVLDNKPRAGPLWIARNLSTTWVFLPCFVLLYERNSPWMLSIAALATLGTALSLRRLLPAPTVASPLPRPQTTILPSLDGLPPRDSPLLLAFGIAILAQTATILAANEDLLLAALPLSIGLFLLVWRWSTVEDRAARWWTGPHPPLPQAVIAVVITSLTLIPYSVVGPLRVLRAGSPCAQACRRLATTPATSASSFTRRPKRSRSSRPRREIRLIRLRQRQAGAHPLRRPLLVLQAAQPPAQPAGAHRPRQSHRRQRPLHRLRAAADAGAPEPWPAHLARPLRRDRRQPHQRRHASRRNLARARTHRLRLARPSIEAARHAAHPSSQLDPMPLKRDPVKEVLRFPIPRPAGLHQFDEITIDFQLSPRHARAGAKVSIDSFELIPK